MRYQHAPGMCGPAAIFNCLSAMTTEDVPSPRTIAKHAGTTVEEGTTEHGIRQGIERCGWGHQVLQAGFEDAFRGLHAHVLGGGTAVVLTEAGDHWEAVVGVLGSRVVILNSDRTDANKAVNGVYILTPRQLRRYWEPYKGQRFAVLVGPGRV